MLVFKGTISCDDDRPAELVVFNVEPAKIEIAEQERDCTAKGLLIVVDSTADKRFERVKSLLSIFDGTTDVYVLDNTTGKKFKVSDSMRVSLNKPMLDELANIVGESNIKLLH